MLLKIVIPNIIDTNLKYQMLLKCLQKNQHFSSVPEIVFLWICLKIILLFYAALSTAFPIFMYLFHRLKQSANGRKFGAEF